MKTVRLKIRVEKATHPEPFRRTLDPDLDPINPRYKPPDCNWPFRELNRLLADRRVLCMKVKTEITDNSLRAA